jgi:hypothetical protein
MRWHGVGAGAKNGQHNAATFFLKSSNIGQRFIPSWLIIGVELRIYWRSQYSSIFTMSSLLNHAERNRVTEEVSCARRARSQRAKRLEQAPKQQAHPCNFLSDIVEYRIAKYHGLAIVSSEKRKISKIIMHCPACGTKTLSNNQEHNAIASVLGFMNKETSYEDAACVSGVS